MNEQMLEQHSEEVLSFTAEVSDEALEAAAGNGLGGTPQPTVFCTKGGLYC